MHARLAAERERALAERLADRDKIRAEPASIGLTSTAIRTFAAWWYEHRDVPRGQVVDAIMDVIQARLHG